MKERMAKVRASRVAKEPKTPKLKPKKEPVEEPEELDLSENQVVIKKPHKVKETKTTVVNNYFYDKKDDPKPSKEQEIKPRVQIRQPVKKSYSFI